MTTRLGRGAHGARRTLGPRGRTLVVWLLAAGGLVAFVLVHPPHLGALVGAFAGVSWGWVAAAAAANLVSILTRTSGWRVVLGKALELPRERPWQTLSAYCVGLLGLRGPDGGRGWQAR